MTTLPHPKARTAERKAAGSGTRADVSWQELRVDKRAPTPAYLQVQEAIVRLVRDGSLPAGSALPSERELAQTLGLSRMTVRRAFRELIAENLVEQRHGSGTYVRPNRHEQTLDRVQSFTEEARTLGFTPGSRLLGHATVAADADVAEALELPEGTPVLRLTRLRTADGEPLAVQIAHVAPHVAELPLAELEEGGLYRSVTKHHGVRPHAARQTVSARLASSLECDLLGVRRSTPVLALERITLDSDGRPFEYVRSAYRSDRYRLVLELPSS